MAFRSQFSAVFKLKTFLEFIMWEELALFVRTTSIKFELMRLEFEALGNFCKGL